MQPVYHPAIPPSTGRGPAASPAQQAGKTAGSGTLAHAVETLPELEYHPPGGGRCAASEPSEVRMPTMGPAERRTPEAYRRVRPAFWLLAPVAIGAAILHVGARRAWFVGALASETHPDLKFALSWAGLGLAYGTLAIAVWALLTRRGRGWKSWIAPLLVCAFMVGGSQYAAQHVSDHLTLVIDGIRWDDEEETFWLHALAAPGVARAYDRGDVRPTVLLETRFDTLRWVGRVPDYGMAGALLGGLRKWNATPAPEHLPGVELVELGWIAASTGHIPLDLKSVMSPPPREVPSNRLLPLTARVTLVDRAERPVGRIAGAAFLLPCGALAEDPPIGYEEGVDGLLRSARSLNGPEERKE